MENVLPPALLSSNKVMFGHQQSLSFSGRVNILVLRLRAEKRLARAATRSLAYDTAPPSRKEGVNYGAPLSRKEGVNYGAPLSRKEVVDLLLLAVNTLLEDENCQRLRERLGKGKRYAEQNLLDLPALSLSSVVQRSDAGTSINSLEDSKVARYYEILERTDALAIGAIHDEKWEPIATSKHKQTSVSAIEGSKGHSEICKGEASPTESVEKIPDASLTGIRKLKVLNVHSYVHRALRESAMRTWLLSRKIEKCP